MDGLERWWIRLRLRVRSVFRSATVEDDLAGETHFHLEERAREFTARGMTPTEAHDAALRSFGGLEQRKEECRDARRVAWIDQLKSDLKYALRTWQRDRTFALTAILTLAFCLAALSTVFTIVDAYYIKRLPVLRPDELAAITATRRHANQLGNVSYPDYLAFRDQTITLQALAAHYSTAPLYVRLGDIGKEINGAVVTANFFPLLGIEPLIGRFFSPEEDAVPNRDHVVVIGHEFWRTHYDGRSDVIGQTVTINGVDFTVIGVVRASFRGLTSMPSHLYLPMMTLSVGYRFCADALAADCTILDMIGRLAPGRRLEEAVAEMPTLMPARWNDNPEGGNKGVTVFSPRRVHHSPNEQRFVALITGVALLLVIVGCANIAGLLSSRGQARAAELAMRASLGAAPGRLLAQLMTEAIALAIAGGALGTLLSWWMIQVIAAQFYSVGPEGEAIEFGFRLPWMVIAGVLLAAVVTGIGFGLVPALAAIRQGATASIPRASVRVTGGRVGLYLVGTQTAAAVILICIALLLGASATRVVSGANFESTHVAQMRLRPRLLQYPTDRAQAFHHQVLERLQALPGVEAASLIGQGVPLFGGGARVTLPGQVPGDADRVNFCDVAPHYFAALSIPLLAGRDFNAHDTIDQPRVAILGNALARRLFGEQSPLGQTININRQSHTIVGVAADITVQARNENIPEFAYAPFWQQPSAVDARYAIRVTGDPGAMLPAIVKAVHQVDPDVPIAETHSLPVQMAGEFRPVRITASFVGYAAVLAFVLTGVGLYGALAFSVSRRTREIGVRLVVGANLRQIMSTVIADAMRVVLTGVVAGLVIAIGAVRLVQNLLLDLPVSDGVFYAASAIGVITIGILACWLPARQAARIDPVMALRCE